MKKMDRFLTRLRQDKSDVLSQDLKEMETKIELIKVSCKDAAKKIEACSRIPTKESQGEARMKKLPEMALASQMKKSGYELMEHEKDSQLGMILDRAGDIEGTIGHLINNFETAVEEEILNSLSKFCKEDFQNMVRSKDVLVKTFNAKTAAETKASRHSVHMANGKIDTSKDEVEELGQKVENYRDHFEAEMYQIVAKEPKICDHILNYLRLQRKFFRDASVFLDTELEEVERQMQQGFRVPVFVETTLEAHLAATNRTIALPMELCACGLILNGLKEEGLFRIAGSASKVKKLKAAFDAGRVDLDYLKQEVCDPHVMANVLKCYLRELPTPLLTYHLHDEWIHAIQIRDSSEKLQELRRVVQKLPNSYYKNLEYLIHFLAYLTTYQEWNKMSPANVAIVIGPNILWPKDESGDGAHATNMTTTRLCSLLVEQFVTNVQEFFPVAGDYDFFVTCERQNDANQENSQVVHNGDGFPSGRSHSVSSLEETSPPSDSPKPHLRRKKAPEPPNPTHSGTSSASSTPNRYAKLMDFPPPSPNQAATKKHTESQGNEEGTPSRTAPPKPPQPNFMQVMGTRDTDTKSALMEKFSAQNSNPRKHNSSFNGSSATARQEMSQSQVNEQVSQNPATNFNSLPRHYHKEHSYNHKRTSSTSRARPPAFTGTVPVSKPAGQAIGTGSTERLCMDESRTSSDASADNKTAMWMDSKDGMKNDHHQPDLQISLKSQSNEPVELQKASAESPVPDSSSISDVSSSPSTVPAEGDSSRPVPAPRSSLVSGSQSFKDKDFGTNPVVKERPVIMAKPRDLSRRSMIVSSSEPLPSSEVTKNQKSSQREESLMEPSPAGDVLDTSRSGLLEDAEMPPKSPKSNPSRPPRPHPPVPPKTRVESTDL